jgi:hypothetical protein
LFYRIVNEFIRIAITLIGISLIAFTIEYFFYLSSEVRMILFYSFMIFIGIYLLINVIIPLLKIAGISFKDDKNKIVSVINFYFPEIKDKLLNVLELEKTNSKYYSSDLLNAAISQKSKELRIFAFTDAIKFKYLLKPGYYFLFSLLITLTLFFLDRSFILEPAERIIHYNVKYEKKPTYDFEILNNELKVKKGDNYKIRVACKGKNLPSVVYINIEGNNFMMKNSGENEFEYEINSVTKPLKIYFTDLVNISGNYMINIFSVPVISHFSVETRPPEYTNKKSERFENTGDLKIPAGTEVKWEFTCYDTDSLIIKCANGQMLTAAENGKNNFNLNERFYKSDIYEVKIKNRETLFLTGMKCNLEIINDLFPAIEVKEIKDSTLLTQIYFNGKITDDYGFTRLNFHLKGEKIDSTIELALNKGMNEQEFYYSVDLKDYKVVEGTVSYFFSVTDNDMINKPKTTLSDTYLFTFPSAEEIKKKDDEELKNMEKLIRESNSLSKNIKSEILRLQMKSMDRGVTDWEKKQMVNDILGQKNQLNSLLDKIENLNKERNDFTNAYSEQNEDIVKKQKELEELLNNVMTDELKKLMDEFNKLSQEFNDKKLNDLNNKLNFSLDDLNRQLDRNLEMLKKFRLEQAIENLIKDIEDTKESEKEGINEITLLKDFEKVSGRVKDDMNALDTIKQEIKKIQEENLQLKRPMIFDTFDGETGDIIKSMMKTKSELDNRNKKSSAESIQSTVAKLENLIFAIRQMLKSNEARNDGEDILTLKRIQKNILYVSLNQEDIIINLANLQNSDPFLRELRNRQKILFEQNKTNIDSIYELAKRNPQIGNMVNQEVVSLNINFDQTLKKLEENNFAEALVSQRLIMTSANNLALFFADIINQMENQMKNSNSDGDCNNGSKGGKMGNLKKAADNLKEQLQNMIDKLKGGKPENMSRELSDALMQHEMMQKMLRDIMNGNEVGGSTKDLLKQIDNILDQNRKDIVNRNIQQNLVNRNNEILSKLLEAEKSEREKDVENKRESNTADKQFYSNPAKYFENRNQRKATKENLQRNVLRVTGYYLDKQKSYSEKLNNN